MSIRTVLAALVLLWASSAVAQKVPSWASSPDAPAAVEDAQRGPGPPPPPPPPPPVPVDGGLGLLALAGAGYAAHKLRGRNQG